MHGFTKPLNDYRPLFELIDSHPVDVCRTVCEGKRKRLDGLCQKGYCASLKRYFIGVREHLVFTPDGYISAVLQVPGNRHDSKGLYEFLKNSFATHLIGDNACWPNDKLRCELKEHNVEVTANVRSNWHITNSKDDDHLFRHRFRVERFISLFDSQFHATKTLNRSSLHYRVRRIIKAVAYNLSRYLNELNFFQKNQSSIFISHHEISSMHYLFY